MVMLGENFNASEWDKPEPMPEGTYLITLYETKLKKTRDNKDYLSLEFKVLRGDHEGRRLYENLMYWHENATTRSIAKRKLGDICRAVGQDSQALTDTEQLQGYPMLAEISVEPQRIDESTGQVYDAKNRIKSFSKYSEGGPSLSDSVPF